MLKPILVFVIVAALNGCAVSHLRMAEDLAVRTNAIHNVLILIPDVEVKMKYIGTDHYVVSLPASELARVALIAGFRDRLVAHGYNLCVERLPWLAEPEYIVAAQKIRSEIQTLTESLIAEDQEYDHDILGIERVKRVQGGIPKAWASYDAVIFCYGNVSLETDKEWGRRWLTNLTYNILLLPLAFASYICPVALPLTLSTSTFIFKPSPDECYLNIVMVDLRDKAIMYQYDYSVSAKGVTRFGDRFHSIANDALEELPVKKAMVRR